MNLTLTATARQARFLRDRWGAQQLENGLTAWETPPILSVQAWMRQQWGTLLQQGVELPLLLTPDQERAVWQQCRPDELIDTSGFLRQEELVDHAMRAYRLFHLWREEVDSLEVLLDEPHQEEMELFASWQQRFQQCCMESQWLNGAELADHLIDVAQQGQMNLPQQIDCYQKPLWNRAEQRLILRLEEVGVELKEYPLPKLVTEPALLVTTDPQVEIRTVADAVQHHLQQYPQHKIGVVVPDLQRRAVEIAEIFGEVLVPELAVHAYAPQQLPFRLSVGKPLLDDPRVHHALQLLRLAQRALPLLEVAALLRSPWLLLGAEMEQRSMLEVGLRTAAGVEITLDALIDLLESVAGEMHSAPRFIGALRSLQALEWDEVKATSGWAQQITSALAFFEWAENGAESAVALAAYNGWREGVDRFVALGEFVGEVDGVEALSRLKKVLSEVELEQGRGSRPVEVLTPDEADGVRFDGVWVMGCDDRQWPQSRPLSPFLPHHWQRQRVPAVDPQQAQRLGREQLARFRESALTPQFSVSQREDATAEPDLMVTPLLGSVPQKMVVEHNPELWWMPMETVELEPIEDVPVELPLGSRLRGGSALLANQAQCPFRAFVRHRLQADALEQPRSGLDARERGTLLHELLERCWREIGRSSAALNALNESALEQLVYKVASGTVEQFRHQHQQRIGVRFAENERQRITELTLQTLSLDQQREAQFEVEEMERQHTVELGGIALSIKMDRVDRLEGGGRVLIDYKSGAVNRSDWSGERPQAPQLPLYTLLLEQVAAVLYSQIRAEEVRYKGVQAEALVMAGAAGGGRSPSVEVAEDWSMQLTEWHHAVEALAVEFRQGIATVDPYHGSQSCSYCGLEPLCRVEH